MKNALCVHHCFLHYSLIGSVDFRTNVTTVLPRSPDFSGAQGNSISHIGGGQLFFGLMAR